MLIWYLGKGHNVLIDKNIQQLINRIGFNSKDIYIFCSSNLCNLTTFVVLLFNDGKIISSDVNADKDSKKALTNALLEAKLLESFFRDSEISPYKLFNQYHHKIIYRYVESLSKKMGDVCNICSIQQNVILLPWITSIEFAVLNTKSYQDFITIRCFSKELLNSIPSKKNILADLNKKIFKQYGINETIILKIPPCIIL